MKQDIKKNICWKQYTKNDRLVLLSLREPKRFHLHRVLSKFLSNVKIVTQIKSIQCNWNQWAQDVSHWHHRNVRCEGWMESSISRLDFSVCVNISVKCQVLWFSSIWRENVSIYLSFLFSPVNRLSKIKLGNICMKWLNGMRVQAPDCCMVTCRSILIR